MGILNRITGTEGIAESPDSTTAGDVFRNIFDVQSAVEDLFSHTDTVG